MYRRHYILRIKSKPPLHIAEGHPLGCVEKTMLPCTEKESASCTYSKGTLCAWCRKDAPSSLYREGVLSPLHKASGDLSSVWRRDFFLCLEMESASPTGSRRTLPPLCRVHTLSFAQRRSVSSSLWRRGAHSHMQREGVCHPRYREERYTLLCDEKSLSTPCIEERDSPLYI